MKHFTHFFSRHKKAVLFSTCLITVAALFRWEVKEVVDAETGKLVMARKGVALPWQECGPALEYGGTRINFHVRHWVCFGLVRITAKGQTYANIGT